MGGITTCTCSLVASFLGHGLESACLCPQRTWDMSSRTLHNRTTFNSWIGSCDSERIYLLLLQFLLERQMSEQ